LCSGYIWRAAARGCARTIDPSRGLPRDTLSDNVMARTHSGAATLSAGICLIATTLLAACAARSPQGLAATFVRRGHGEGVGEIALPSDPATTKASRAAIAAALSQAWRDLQSGHDEGAATRASSGNPAEAVERTNQAIAIAKLRLSVAPTADSHRDLADMYAQLGVDDIAFDHYEATLRLARHDAGAADGLARIWRDWGYPDRALPYAYRAVYDAPRSAAAQNTLGTVLLRLGYIDAAEQSFSRALDFAPSASYALNNLCYAAVMRGLPNEAVRRCEQARVSAPKSATALNNLALAYAAVGDFDSAAVRFAAATPGARAKYNLGIALMARGRYAAAATAFDAATALGPGLSVARARARQARTLGKRASAADLHATHD
jgi:tetratricopeptide (TPR) repeat protein